MSRTTAIILAGGLGTRLRPILSDHPKVLALAAGKPFLHYIFTYLASQGIKNVTVSVGYLADQVRAYAGTGQAWGIEVRYVQESSPLGTGGAARLASAGLHKPFIILNGDTLFLVDLAALIHAHSQSKAPATLCLRLMTDIETRGRVEMDDTGMIRDFHEKPQDRGAALANGGIYLFDPGTLDAIPAGQPASLEKDFFPQLAQSGKLSGYVQQAYFCDIGTPETLAAFERDFLSGKVDLP
jgi:NDP-sugar pyrophosphorylase family protein